MNVAAKAPELKKNASLTSDQISEWLLTPASTQAIKIQHSVSTYNIKVETDLNLIKVIQVGLYFLCPSLYFLSVWQVANQQLTHLSLSALNRVIQAKALWFRLLLMQDQLSATILIVNNQDQEWVNRKAQTVPFGNAVIKNNI